NEGNLEGQISLLDISAAPAPPASPTAPRKSWPRTKQHTRLSGCPAKRRLQVCRVAGDHRAARQKRKTRPCRYGRFCASPSSNNIIPVVLVPVVKVSFGLGLLTYGIDLR